MKRISSVFILVLLLLSLIGCEANPKCIDVCKWTQSNGYLDGWTYVKDIEALDNNKDEMGRYYFALFENNEVIGKYAVLEVLANTDGSFSAEFNEANYDESTNTAESLDKTNHIVSLVVTYEESGIELVKD